VIAVNREFRASDPESWVNATREVAIELPFEVAGARELFTSRSIEFVGAELTDQRTETIPVVGGDR